VRQLSIRRGRNNELARVEAGTLDLLLDNRSARFNPENSSGPYYGNLVPKRQVRVWARSGATEKLLFTGFVGGWPQEFPDSGSDAVARVSATDMMGLLARARFSPPPPLTLIGSITDSATSLQVSATGTIYWPTGFPYVITIDSEDLTVTSAAGAIFTVTRGANGTTATAHPGGSVITTTEVGFDPFDSGNMIHQAIRNSLWPNLGEPGGYYGNIAVGKTTLQSGVLTSDSNPLEFVHKCADSEAGQFFAGVDGFPVFNNRHYRITNTTSTATFGEGPGEIPYQDVEISHDEQQLYNNIVITLAGGQKVTASDTTSQAAFWPATLSRETIGLAGEAQDLAYYLLGRLKNPQLRVPDLVLDGHTVSGTTLIGLDLDQRYTVKRRPASGTAISKVVFVEGIEHSLAPATWMTSLDLSNADVEAYWILGTSQLGVDTKLAY